MNRRENPLKIGERIHKYLLGLAAVLQVSWGISPSTLEREFLLSKCDFLKKFI